MAAVLGLTPLGCPAGRRRSPGRSAAAGSGRCCSAVVALTVIGRLVTLPLSAYGEVVYHRYGLSTSSWGLWLRDVAVTTAISAGLTALALLGLVALARQRAPHLVDVGALSVRPPSSSPARSCTRCCSSPRSTGSPRCRPARCAATCSSWRSATGRRCATSSSPTPRAAPPRSTPTCRASGRPGGSSSTTRCCAAARRREIESIAAHELGHVSADDVLTGTLIGSLGAAAGVALLGWLLSWGRLLGRAGADWARGPARRPVAVVPGRGRHAAVHAVAERGVAADRGAGRRARPGPHPGSAGLRDHAARLAVSGLAEPEPPALWQWFFGSHPTTAERVALARDWVRLGRG